MNQNVKTSVIRSVWVGLMTGVVILCTSAINHKKAAVLTGINIKVDGFEHGDVFLTEGDVRAEITASLGEVESRLISEVDVSMLEAALYQNPFVEHADVYISSDGLLSVTIHQREPLMRVFTDDGLTYYVDRHGMRLPVSPNFTARVVVVTGGIDNILDESVIGHKQLGGIYHLVQEVEGDPFLRSLVEQIDVTRNGAITLVPKMGDTVIRFGHARNIPYKLASLKSFYTQVVRKRGWDQYENINLAYDGQIVCKRKES